MGRFEEKDTCILVRLFWKKGIVMTYIGTSGTIIAAIMVTYIGTDGVVLSEI